MSFTNDARLYEIATRVHWYASLSALHFGHPPSSFCANYLNCFSKCARFLMCGVRHNLYSNSAPESPIDSRTVYSILMILPISQWCDAVRAIFVRSITPGSALRGHFLFPLHIWYSFVGLCFLFLSSDQIYLSTSLEFDHLYQINPSIYLFSVEFDCFEEIFNSSCFILK